jgi:hypothetical protein
MGQLTMNPEDPNGAPGRPRLRAQCENAEARDKQNRKHFKISSFTSISGADVDERGPGRPLSIGEEQSAPSERFRGDRRLDSHPRRMTRTDPSERRQRFEATALPLLQALYGYAIHLTRNGGTARDLVQETYLRA